MPTPPLAPPLAFDVPDEAATAQWAAALAEALHRVPGADRSVWSLAGDLGAGKTTWVRWFLRHLGVQGRIKSPTYAVVEPHDCPAAAAWPQGLVALHFDFYRFNDPNEWEDAGFRDLFANPGIKLVEWADKAQPHLPAIDVQLRLSRPDPGHESLRQLTLEGLTPLGQALVQAALLARPHEGAAC